MAMTGGLGGPNPADSEIQTICEKVKADVEAKLGETFNMFLASHYRSQMVAGVNYYIKVNVAEGKWIHIKVYKSLPNDGSNIKLTGVQKDKTKDDSIEFF